MATSDFRDRATRERASMAAAGVAPMTLDASRKCPGGTTRVTPRCIRGECRDCARLRPYAEEPGLNDIDPAGAWVGANVARSGYCRERLPLSLLSAEQVVARGAAAGVHSINVLPALPSEKAGEFGGVHTSIAQQEDF